jgi:hypothetical protein
LTRRQCHKAVIEELGKKMEATSSRWFQHDNYLWHLYRKDKAEVDFFKAITDKINEKHAKLMLELSK